jgi:basic amino acid/polyamine antiporter, APA family
VPLAAIGCCGYLTLELPMMTWIRFFGWMALGLILYFLYGFRRSRLAGTDGAKQTGAGQ